MFTEGGQEVAYNHDTLNRWKASKALDNPKVLNAAPIHDFHFGPTFSLTRNSEKLLIRLTGKL